MAAIAAVEILFTFLLAYVVLAVATTEEQTVSMTKPKQNFYFALAIGFTMFAGCFASSEVSGGYINPAVALGFYVESRADIQSSASVEGWPEWTDFILQGIALVCKFFACFGQWLLYLAFELAGAVMAAGLFRLTHSVEYQKKMPALITHVDYPLREQ